MEKQTIDDVFAFYWDDVLDDVLVIEFLKTYTWDDYYTLMERVFHYIDGRVDEVDYINILANNLVLPHGSPLPHTRNMLNRFNNPFIVTIDNKQQAFYMNFLSLIGRVLNAPPPPLAQSMEDARTTIISHRNQNLEKPQ